MILMFGEIPEGVENINIVWCVNLFQQISNKTLNFPSTIKKIRIKLLISILFILIFRIIYSEYFELNKPPLKKVLKFIANF